MTGRNHVGRIWSTCPDCGKRGYTSKQGAKTTLRSHPDRQGMRIYRCDSGTYHLGHDNGYGRAHHRQLHRNAS